MKTGKVLLLTAIVLLGIVVYLNKCKSPQQGLPQSIKSQQPLLVTGIIASAGIFEEKIYSSGTILANDEVEIRNEIAGKITAIVFKEGTRVKKGDLLLTLFDDDLRAQVKKLELQKELNQKAVERQSDLLKVSGISQQDYELTINQLHSTEADLEIIRSQLSKTQIRAPFDGIIGLKSVSRGAYLAMNTQIATIQTLDPVKLDFSLPERYKPMIEENSEIHFTTESTEGMFTGKIYAFEPKIDLKTRSVLVRAICENKDFKLFPGAFAHIEIPLQKISDAILIPTQALIPELKGQKVFISKNGKAEKVDVITGVRNDSAIRITSGIRAGDTVLITGLMQAKPGSAIQVKIKN
jgi:membrane fusion protein (multidrug efflux system)